MRFNWIAATTLFAVFTALSAPGVAQQREPQLPRQSPRAVPMESSGMDAAGQQSPFFGAVTSGTASPDEISLSLADAVSRGLKNNLGKILSAQSTRNAQGEQLRARSALLPNITSRTGETVQQTNLAAFGFSSFPGIENTIIGPFGIFDTRAYLSQSVFDFSAISNARQSSENLKAANLSYDNARDIVVTVVANLYLQAIAGASRIEAAAAQVKTAQALYDQAVSFKQAGVVPGIEVLRSQVELQARQQQLIFYQNEFEKQKLSVARAIGMPPGQRFRLTDAIPYSPLPDMRLEDSLTRAYANRSDYQQAQALVRAAEYAKKAAEGERLPTVSIDADYGALGQTPSQSHGTFTTSASLRIPIFQGGRTRGEILQADAQREQRKADLEDIRSRIEYEIRNAFLDLKAAGDRVTVARSALDLSQQQMTQAQDRFAAGVTSNIEVVQAQEALASANENLIAATFAYNTAKTSLARSLGGAEQNFRQFLLGEK